VNEDNDIQREEETELAEVSDISFDVDESSSPQPKEPDGAPASQEDAGLREENEQLRADYLRARADFENFRKRSEREKGEFVRYAQIAVVRELLPVLDNFERAIASDTDAAGDFRAGVELIYKQFSDVLEKQGVTVIDQEGVPFDPTIHEAMMREETTEYPSYSIMHVFQKGYMLHDRLIRPAMVKVAVEPESGDTQ
jgi:molecular chaperone GrpE